MEISDDITMTTQTASNSPSRPTPKYLTGPYRPIDSETSADNLHVEGTIPFELRGRYLRNGANPPRAEDPGHGFLGQGMIHGIRIAEGRAKWYRNRWVKTPALAGVPMVDQQGNLNLAAGIANTHVVEHAGQILALVESALPYAISPELDTKGVFDFSGALRTPMTAHPKRDPATGELLFFGYSARPPFVTFHVATPAGRLTRSEEITFSGPAMLHDFAITENHVIWFDMPHRFDPALMGHAAMPYRWHDAHVTRIGVMPRSGGDKDVKWYPVSASMLYHVANAYETAGRIVIQAIRYDEQQHKTMWREYGGIESKDAAPVVGPYLGGNLHEWVIDRRTGDVAERRLHGLGIEFPTINSERLGRPHSFVYAVGHPFLDGGRLVKFDLSPPNLRPAGGHHRIARSSPRRIPWLVDQRRRSQQGVRRSYCWRSGMRACAPCLRGLAWSLASMSFEALEHNASCSL